MGVQGGLAFCVGTNSRRFGVIEFLSSRPRHPDFELLELIDALSTQIGTYAEAMATEQEARRMKDEFVSLVSRIELRTPLTSVIGYLELLAEGENLDETQATYLSAVTRNADRLLSLINELLLVAQIQAGKLAVERQSVDCGRIARERVDVHRHLARREGRRGLLLGQHPDPTLGDETRIGQIVDNLVGNALKFTPPGGRVDVRVFSENGSVVLEVSDTGIGIPQAEHSNIFRRALLPQLHRRERRNPRDGPRPLAHEGARRGTRQGQSPSRARRRGSGPDLRVELPARDATG